MSAPFKPWKNVTKSVVCGLGTNQKASAPHVSEIQDFKVEDELVIFLDFRRQLLFLFGPINQLNSATVKLF